LDVLKIVEDLYEGALDPVVWDRAILTVADSVRASGAMLFAFNPSNQAVLRDENHRVDPQVVSDYARYWTFEDFRLRYLFAQPTGQPATEVSIGIPLKGSRLYHEFLLPVDLPHFLPVWLHKSKEKMVCLSLQGSNKRGPFDVADLETIRRILPHFARAFEIRDRLEAAEVRASNFANLLNTTTFGVIVLNGQKRILEANAVALALLEGGSGLQRGKDGVLLTNYPGGDRVFKYGDTSTSRGAADALTHIPRDGKLPMSVLVLPIRAWRTSWMSGEPVWALLLFDPERKLAVNQQLIMRDLDLSEREANVAALLAAGFQLDQIARRMHVTVHTVRSQLKSAFQKTGCHTQAQLVKRLLLGPGFA
jgi:DNA-binding CsgD family transcriptional regulator/PAS domain-containing protein